MYVKYCLLYILLCQKLHSYQLWWVKIAFCYNWNSSVWRKRCFINSISWYIICYIVNLILNERLKAPNKKKIFTLAQPAAWLQQSLKLPPNRRLPISIRDNESYLPFSRINWSIMKWGLLWLLLYGRWICNYLCNQCPTPLMLWVWILLKWSVLNTTLCDSLSATCGKSVGFSGYYGFLHQ